VCVSKVVKPFVCEFVGWVMLSVLYVGVCVCVSKVRDRSCVSSRAVAGGLCGATS